MLDFFRNFFSEKKSYSTLTLRTAQFTKMLDVSLTFHC